MNLNATLNETLVESSQTSNAGYWWTHVPSLIICTLPVMAAKVLFIAWLWWSNTSEEASRLLLLFSQFQLGEFCSIIFSCIGCALLLTCESMNPLVFLACVWECCCFPFVACWGCCGCPGCFSYLLGSAKLRKEATATIPPPMVPPVVAGLPEEAV